MMKSHKKILAENLNNEIINETITSEEKYINELEYENANRRAHKNYAKIRKMADNIYNYLINYYGIFPNKADDLFDIAKIINDLPAQMFLDEIGVIKQLEKWAISELDYNLAIPCGFEAAKETICNKVLNFLYDLIDKKDFDNSVKTLISLNILNMQSLKMRIELKNIDENNIFVRWFKQKSKN